LTVALRNQLQMFNSSFLHSSLLHATVKVLSKIFYIGQNYHMNKVACFCGPSCIFVCR